MELTKEQELFQTVIEKAWEDTAFKADLIENPINTIETLTGKRLNIPEGKSLVVKDQTDESIVFLNIPVQISMDDIELNEEQLEIIAGGGDPLPVIQTSVSTDPLNGMVENDIG